MSDLAARNDVAGLRHTMGETLRAILVLTLPATCALILLGRPALTLLYQRGAFDAASTQAVYVALRFFALGLVGHACLELAARAFFAQQDTVTPLLVAIGSAVLNIGLAIVLMRPMGHGGLALANSLAVSVEVAILLLILRRRWGSVEGRQTLNTMGRSLGATLLMGLAMAGALALGRGAGFSSLWLLIAGGIAGGIVYLGAGYVLNLRTLYRLPSAVLGSD
jgi:putative peptidoglycan lipid II flippase